MHLLREIEKYLKTTGMPATKFGREAVNDPRLVTDLRNGREPQEKTILRVRDYMEAPRVAG